MEPEPADIQTEESTGSHWRAWVAVAVLAVFAILGVVEWRSQVNQTDNGPVEIIRAKMHSWRHGNASSANNEPAPPPVASTDSNAKPEMQVQEQPKPQTADQNGAANGAGGSAAGTGAGTAAPPANPSAAGTANPPPTPAVNSSPPPKESSSASTPKPAGGEKQEATDQGTTTKSATPERASTASQKAALAPPAKIKPSRGSESGDSAAQPTTPGAEEMAKARNASDASATAAWLWKATAKGNPEAPVQLADMYARGVGVPRSCEQALVLLKTAAAKENAPARNRLATMYSTGNCVQRNRVEAYRWLSAALDANPSSQWAQQNRDLLWQQMTPDERAAAARYR
jgi:hypothetical protein